MRRRPDAAWLVLALCLAARPGSAWRKKAQKRKNASPPPGQQATGCRDAAGRWIECGLRAAGAPPKPVTVFYNVFAKPGGGDLAARIVDEQLRALRASPLWPSVAEIRYASVGAGTVRGVSIDAAVARICDSVGVGRCVHLGHHKIGGEGITLAPLWEFCVANPTAAVTYLHNKGSFNPTPENHRLRRALLRGFSSQECADAITQGTTCDVCSMRFSPFPHQHVSGNMWTAACDYVARLAPPREFRGMMEKHWRPIVGYEEWTWPTFGMSRFANEHWVHSHPSVRPCDTLDSPFTAGYEGLPGPNYTISFAMAPRYPPFHPYKARNPGLKGRIEEWRALYQAVPPENSLLLRFYREG